MDVCYSMDESQKHMLKKAVRNEYLCTSLFHLYEVPQQQTHLWWYKSEYQLPLVGAYSLESDTREFGGVMKMFYIFIWVLVSWVSTELEKPAQFSFCVGKNPIFPLLCVSITHTLPPHSHRTHVQYFWSLNGGSLSYPRQTPCDAGCPQFWHSLPGGTVRAHRVRLQTPIARSSSQLLLTTSVWSGY